MSYPIPIEPRSAHANPTILSLTSNAVLSAASQYIVRVTPNVAGHTLTISTLKSHLIQNEGSVSFNLATVGNTTTTIQPGSEARAAWSDSGANHELQVSTGGGSVTVDGTMSDSSTNPVQNMVVKSYIDAGDAAAATGVMFSFAYGGHGLVSGDVGKPITRTTGGGWSVWNDTGSGQQLYMLGQVTDANNLKVYTLGQRITGLDINLIQVAGWNQFSDGPFLYWDFSVGKYVKTKPADQYDYGPCIQVLQQFASTFDCVFLI